GPDRKLVGVLNEGAALPGGGVAVVVGIGVNVAMDASACAAMYRPATSNLLETGAASEPERLLATLCRRVFDAVDLAYNGGLAPLHARWAAASRLVGQAVTVTTPQGPLSGTVDALNP